MIIICPILFLGYKFVRHTTLHRAEDVDLFKGLKEVEEYERTFVPTPPK